MSFGRCSRPPMVEGIRGRLATKLLTNVLRFERSWLAYVEYIWITEGGIYSVQSH
jgi:hypothetical protein